MFFSKWRSKSNEPPKETVQFNKELATSLFKTMVKTLEAGYLMYYGLGTVIRKEWSELKPTITDLPEGVGFDLDFDYIDTDGNRQTLTAEEMEQEYRRFIASPVLMGQHDIRKIIKKYGESGIIDGVHHKYLSFCVLEYKRICKTLDLLEQKIGPIK